MLNCQVGLRGILGEKDLSNRELIQHWQARGEELIQQIPLGYRSGWWFRSIGRLLDALWRVGLRTLPLNQSACVFFFSQWENSVEQEVLRYQFSSLAGSSPSYAGSPCLRLREPHLVPSSTHKLIWSNDFFFFFNILPTFSFSPRWLRVQDLFHFFVCYCNPED